MSGWIFATGRDGESPLADVTAVGAQSVALAAADQTFAVGQHLFIGEADGSETQWLGRVTFVNSNSIGFSRPLAKSKNSGAKIWRALSALETPAAPALPEKRTLDGGVALERSRGGDWFAVQFAEPREGIALTLDGLTPATELGLIAWMQERAGWGLNAFTLIDTAGSLLAVRLQSGSEQPLRRDRQNGGRARITLSLWILGEGIYA